MVWESSTTATADFTSVQYESPRFNRLVNIGPPSRLPIAEVDGAGLEESQRRKRLAGAFAGLVIFASLFAAEAKASTSFNKSGHSALIQPLNRNTDENPQFSSVARLTSGSTMTEANVSIGSLEYTGITTNKILSEDPNTADKYAKMVAATGANAVHIELPWTYPYQAAEIIHDTTKVCNAYRKALDNGLQVTATIQGFYENGDTGAVPARSMIRKLSSTVGAYMFTLYGPDGCVKDLSNIDLVLNNEPNGRDPKGSQFFDGTAADYVREIKQVIPSAVKDAKKISQLRGKKVGVSFGIGAVAPSQDKKPFRFVEAMGRAMDKQGIKDFRDLVENEDDITFDWHFYPAKPGQSVAENVDFYDQLVDELKDNLHYTGPISFGEAGADKSILSKLIKSGAIDKPKDISPSKFTGEYMQNIRDRDMFRWAACAGVVTKMYLFGLTAEPTGPQTAVYRTNETPTDGMYFIKDGMSVRNGIDCSTIKTSKN